MVTSKSIYSCPFTRYVTPGVASDTWLDLSEDNPYSQFLITVMGGVNQLERDLIRMRQREGIEIAKREGKFKGKLKKYHKDHAGINYAIKLYREGNMTVKQICQITNISRSTLYRRISEEKSWVYANNLTATKPPREIGIMPVGTKFRSPTDFPNYQSGGFHGGTDIASAEGAALGDPIKASFAGKVVDVVKSVKGFDATKGFGNYVKIKSLINGKNYYTYYCHMLYGSVKVSKGNTVSKGQVIGKMGNTGKSYGAHLHLEYRVMPYSPRASHVVDPRKFY